MKSYDNSQKIKDLRKEAEQGTPYRCPLHEEEYKQIVANAAKCGMPKSLYVHNTVLGHLPKQLMTDGQEEALKNLSAARSELVGIRNALHGLPQEVRKRYFKNERFMEAWIEGINYLIRQWDAIREKFMG